MNTTYNKVSTEGYNKVWSRLYTIPTVSRQVKTKIVVLGIPGPYLAGGTWSTRPRRSNYGGTNLDFFIKHANQTVYQI